MKKLFNLKLDFNVSNVVATIAVTLLILVDKYHNFTGSVALDRLILFLFVPLFIIVVVLRGESGWIMAFGWGIGRPG